MKPIPAGGVRRILIRANNWIGDVVMISPAVRAIREHYRDARVAILAKRWVIETLRGNPFYDDLIEYDDEGAHRGPAGLLRLAARLRREAFDLALLFQKAFEAAVIARLAGIPLRVGYSADRRSPLLTHALPQPPPHTHHVDVFLGIARALGCAVCDPIPFFHVDADSRARAAQWLGNAGARGDRPIAAIHPGASKEPRAWHAGRFAELGRRLADRIGARVLVLAGPPDRIAEATIRRRIPDACLLPAAPEPTIQFMAGLIERCDLFIGNDSGPMHIAAALDVPTIALFGPGSPGRTAPRAPSGRVVPLGRDYPCAPCRQDFFRECSPAPSGKPFCLEEITVEEVERAAADLLGRAPVRTPIPGGSARGLPADPAQA